MTSGRSLLSTCNVIGPESAIQTEKRWSYKKNTWFGEFNWKKTRKSKRRLPVRSSLVIRNKESIHAVMIAKLFNKRRSSQMYSKARLENLNTQLVSWCRKVNSKAAKFRKLRINEHIHVLDLDVIPTEQTCSNCDSLSNQSHLIHCSNNNPDTCHFSVRKLHESSSCKYCERKTQVVTLSCDKTVDIFKRYHCIKCAKKQFKCRTAEPLIVHPPNTKSAIAKTSQTSVSPPSQCFLKEIGNHNVTDEYLRYAPHCHENKLILEKQCIKYFQGNSGCRVKNSEKLNISEKSIDSSLGLWIGSDECESVKIKEYLSNSPIDCVVNKLFKRLDKCKEITWYENLSEEDIVRIVVLCTHYSFVKVSKEFNIPKTQLLKWKKLIRTNRQIILKKQEDKVSRNQPLKAGKRQIFSRINEQDISVGDKAVFCSEFYGKMKFSDIRKDSQIQNGFLVDLRKSEQFSWIWRDHFRLFQKSDVLIAELAMNNPNLSDTLVKANASDLPISQAFEENKENDKGDSRNKSEKIDSENDSNIHILRDKSDTAFKQTSSGSKELVGEYFTHSLISNSKCPAFTVSSSSEINESVLTRTTSVDICNMHCQTSSSTSNPVCEGKIDESKHKQECYPVQRSLSVPSQLKINSVFEVDVKTKDFSAPTNDTVSSPLESTLNNMENASASDEDDENRLIIDIGAVEEGENNVFPFSKSRINGSSHYHQQNPKAVDEPVTEKTVCSELPQKESAEEIKTYEKTSKDNDTLNESFLCCVDSCDNYSSSDEESFDIVREKLNPKVINETEQKCITCESKSVDISKESCEKCFDENNTYSKTSPVIDEHSYVKTPDSDKSKSSEILIHEYIQEIPDDSMDFEDVSKHTDAFRNQPTCWTTPHRGYASPIGQYRLFEGRMVLVYESDHSDKTLKNSRKKTKLEGKKKSRKNKKPKEMSHAKSSVIELKKTQNANDISFGEVKSLLSLDVALSTIISKVCKKPENKSSEISFSNNFLQFVKSYDCFSETYRKKYVGRESRELRLSYKRLEKAGISNHEQFESCQLLKEEIVLFALKFGLTAASRYFHLASSEIKCWVNILYKLIGESETPSASAPHRSKAKSAVKKKKLKLFSTELKIKLLHLADTHGIKKISDTYNIPYPTIQRWRKVVDVYELDHYGLTDYDLMEIVEYNQIREAMKEHAKEAAQKEEFEGQKDKPKKVKGNAELNETENVIKCNDKTEDLKIECVDSISDEQFNANDLSRQDAKRKKRQTIKSKPSKNLFDIKTKKDKEAEEIEELILLPSYTLFDIRKTKTKENEASCTSRENVKSAEKRRGINETKMNYSNYVVENTEEKESSQDSNRKMSSLSESDSEEMIEIGSWEVSDGFAHCELTTSVQQSMDKHTFGPTTAFKCQGSDEIASFNTSETTIKQLSGEETVSQACTEQSDGNLTEGMISDSNTEKQLENSRQSKQIPVSRQSKQIPVLYQSQIKPEPYDEEFDLVEKGLKGTHVKDDESDSDSDKDERAERHSDKDLLNPSTPDNRNTLQTRENKTGVCHGLDINQMGLGTGNETHENSFQLNSGSNNNSGTSNSTSNINVGSLGVGVGSLSNLPTVQIVGISDLQPGQDYYIIDNAMLNQGIGQNQPSSPSLRSLLASQDKNVGKSSTTTVVIPQKGMQTSSTYHVTQAGTMMPPPKLLIGRTNEYAPPPPPYGSSHYVIQTFSSSSPVVATPPPLQCMTTLIPQQVVTKATTTTPTNLSQMKIIESAPSEENTEKIQMSSALSTQIMQKMARPVPMTLVKNMSSPTNQYTSASSTKKVTYTTVVISPPPGNNLQKQQVSQGNSRHVVSSANFGASSNIVQALSSHLNSPPKAPLILSNSSMAKRALQFSGKLPYSNTGNQSTSVTSGTDKKSIVLPGGIGALTSQTFSEPLSKSKPQSQAVDLSQKTAQNCTDLNYQCFSSDKDNVKKSMEEDLVVEKADCEAVKKSAIEKFLDLSAYVSEDKIDKEKAIQTAFLSRKSVSSVGHETKSSEKIAEKSKHVSSTGVLNPAQSKFERTSENKFTSSKQKTNDEFDIGKLPVNDGDKQSKPPIESRLGTLIQSVQSRMSKKCSESDGPKTSTLAEQNSDETKQILENISFSQVASSKRKSKELTGKCENKMESIIASIKDRLTGESSKKDEKKCSSNEQTQLPERSFEHEDKKKKIDSTCSKAQPFDSSELSKRSMDSEGKAQKLQRRGESRIRRDIRDIKKGVVVKEASNDSLETDSENSSSSVNTYTSEAETIDSTDSSVTEVTTDSIESSKDNSNVNLSEKLKSLLNADIFNVIHSDSDCTSEKEDAESDDPSNIPTQTLDKSSKSVCDKKDSFKDSKESVTSKNVIDLTVEDEVRADQRTVCSSMSVPVATATENDAENSLLKASAQFLPKTIKQKFGKLATMFSIASLSRKYGINSKTISTWKKQYGDEILESVSFSSQEQSMIERVKAYNQLQKSSLKKNYQIYVDNPEEDREDCVIIDGNKEACCSKTDLEKSRVHLSKLLEKKVHSSEGLAESKQVDDNTASASNLYINVDEKANEQQIEMIRKRFKSLSDVKDKNEKGSRRQVTSIFGDAPSESEGEIKLQKVQYLCPVEGVFKYKLVLPDLPPHPKSTKSSIQDKKRHQSESSAHEHSPTQLDERYSANFKIAVVKEARKSGFEKTSKLYNVSMTDLMKWHDCYLQGGEAALQSATEAESKAQRKKPKINANLSFEKFQKREGAIMKPRFGGPIKPSTQTTAASASVKQNKTRMGPNTPVNRRSIEQLQQFQADVQGDLGIMPKFVKQGNSKKDADIEIASTWKQVQSIISAKKPGEKKYSDEFKKKIIKECESKGQKSVSENHRIPYNEISRWRLEAKKLQQVKETSSRSSSIEKSELVSSKPCKRPTSVQKTSTEPSGVFQTSEFESLSTQCNQQNQNESLKIKLKIKLPVSTQEIPIPTSSIEKEPSKVRAVKDKTEIIPDVIVKKEVDNEETMPSQKHSKEDLCQSESIQGEKNFTVSLDEEAELKMQVINYGFEHGVLKTQKKYNFTRQSIIDLMKEFDEMTKYSADTFDKEHGYQSLKTKLISREKTSVEVTTTAQPVIVKNLTDYIVTPEYKCNVVEYAKVHGITAASRKFKRKANTVRTWINEFQREEKKKITEEQIVKELELLRSNVSVEEARKISYFEARKKRVQLENEFRNQYKKAVVEFAKKYSITDATKKYKKKAQTIKSWMGHFAKAERDAKRSESDLARSESSASDSPVKNVKQPDEDVNKMVEPLQKANSPPNSPIWEQDFIIKPSSSKSPLKMTFSPRRKSSPVIVLESSADEEDRFGDSENDEVNDIETEDEEEGKQLVELSTSEFDANAEHPNTVLNQGRIETPVIVVTDESNNNASAAESSNDKKHKKHENASKNSVLTVESDNLIDPAEVPNILESGDFILDIDKAESQGVSEKNKENTEKDTGGKQNLNVSFIGTENDSEEGSEDDDIIEKIPYEDTVMFKVFTEEMDQFFKDTSSVMSKEASAVRPKKCLSADAKIVANIEETFLFTENRATRKSFNKEKSLEQPDVDNAVKVNNGVNGHDKDMPEDNRIENKHNKNTPETIEEFPSMLSKKNTEPKEDKEAGGKTGAEVLQTEIGKEIKNLDQDSLVQTNGPEAFSESSSKPAENENANTEDSINVGSNTGAFNNILDCHQKSVDEIKVPDSDFKNSVLTGISQSKAEVSINSQSEKRERSLFDFLSTEETEKEDLNKDTKQEPKSFPSGESKVNIFGSLMKNLKLPSLPQTSIKSINRDISDDNKTQKLEGSAKDSETQVVDKSERNLFDLIGIEKVEEPEQIKAPIQSPVKSLFKPVSTTKRTLRSNTHLSQTVENPPEISQKKPMFKFPKLALPVNFGSIAKLGMAKIKGDSQAKLENTQETIVDKGQTSESNVFKIKKHTSVLTNTEVLSQSDSVKKVENERGVTKPNVEEGRENQLNSDNSTFIDLSSPSGVVMETFEQLRQRLAQERALAKVEKEKEKSPEKSDEVDENSEKITDKMNNEDCEKEIREEEDEMYKDFTPEKIVLILDISKKHGIDFASTSFGLPVSVIVNWILEKDRKHRKVSLSISLEDKLLSLKSLKDGNTDIEEIAKRHNVMSEIVRKWEAEDGWLLDKKGVFDVLDKWNNVKSVTSLNISECKKIHHRCESTIHTQGNLKECSSGDKENSEENVCLENNQFGEKTDETVAIGDKLSYLQKSDLQGELQDSANNKHVSENAGNQHDTNSVESLFITDKVPDILSFISSTPARDYTIEQKAICVVLAKKFGEKEVCYKLGINPTTLGRWVHKKTVISDFLEEQTAGFRKVKRAETPVEQTQKLSKPKPIKQNKDTLSEESRSYRMISPTKIPSILKNVKKPSTKTSIKGMFSLEQKVAIVKLVELYGVRQIHKQFRISPGSIWNWQHSKAVKDLLKGETKERETSENTAKKQLDFQKSSSNPVPDIGNENVSVDIVLDRVLVKSESSKDHSNLTQSDKADIVFLVHQFGVDYVCEKLPMLPRGTLWNWRHSRHILPLVEKMEGKLKDKMNTSEKGSVIGSVVSSTVDKTGMTQKWLTECQAPTRSSKRITDRKRDESVENVKKRKLDGSENDEFQGSEIADGERTFRDSSPSSICSDISIHSDDFEEIESDGEVNSPSVHSKRSGASSLATKSGSGKTSKRAKIAATGKDSPACQEKTENVSVTSHTEEKIEKSDPSIYEVLKIEWGPDKGMMVCYKTVNGKQFVF